MVSKKNHWSLSQWLSYLENLHPKTIDLGLGRVAEVYSLLGRPRPAKKIISIAGTNGKGSVVAHITALAMACGYSCGSHTSPHLLAFNERIQVAGRPVDDLLICQAFLQIETARGGISLSYFEFATLAAILLMAVADLDLAVFEVGLGGRLDAVNILDADVAVITSIALDHQQWLGNSRTSIALEKAGIFRAAEQLPQALVIGDREPPVSLLQAVQQSAQPAYFLGGEFDWQTDNDGIRIDCGKHTINLPASPLLAPIQNDNLTVAWCALSGAMPATELMQKLDRVRLERLFKALPLRGRLEKISSYPDIYVDVAHNPAAAEILSQWLESNPTAGKTWAVCAMLADKDHEQVLACIDKSVNGWYLADISGVRGQTGEALLVSSRGSISKPVRVYSDIKIALRAAVELARLEDRIIVFGSFLAVARVITVQNQ